MLVRQGMGGGAGERGMPLRSGVGNLYQSSE